MNCRNSLCILIVLGLAQNSIAQQPAQQPTKHAAGTATTAAGRDEGPTSFTPIPGERKEGYANVGGKNLFNINFSASSSGALVRIPGPTSGSTRTEPGFLSAAGVPCVHSPEQKKIDGTTCRPLDPNNAVEKATIDELAIWIGSRPERDKSPFAEFLAWHQNGYRTEPPLADALGDKNDSNNPYATYNANIEEYRKKLKGAEAEIVAQTLKQLQDTQKIEDPKKRNAEIEGILARVFTQGMEAPEVESGTKGWREIAGSLTTEQNKEAAKHYSATQVAARKSILQAVSKGIRGQNPQVADVIDRVSRGAAQKSYNLLLSDSYNEGSPQCATCGGMPRQAEFDTGITEGISAAMKAIDPRANIASASMNPGSAAVATMVPEKPVFRLGSCFFCKSAAPAYNQRVKEIRSWIEKTYPGARIEEYDAASAGEIDKGELKIALKEGGATVHTPIRSGTAEFLKGMMEKLPPRKK